jgi:hypothetical protein
VGSGLTDRSEDTGCDLVVVEQRKGA